MAKVRVDADRRVGGQQSESVAGQRKTGGLQTASTQPAIHSHGKWPMASGIRGVKEERLSRAGGLAWPGLT